ncbi:hypothetical protein [Nocardia sp. R7R-8]|uniref:hypothetical protein n=1 Tax=Nocardia sp. R7R-8 TaxID=3459304 RepID=UPI00403DC10F
MVILVFWSERLTPELSAIPPIGCLTAAWTSIIIGLSADTVSGQQLGWGGLAFSAGLGPSSGRMADFIGPSAFAIRMLFVCSNIAAWPSNMEASPSHKSESCGCSATEGWPRPGATRDITEEGDKGLRDKRSSGVVVAPPSICGSADVELAHRLMR